MWWIGVALGAEGLCTQEALDALADRVDQDHEEAGLLAVIGRQQHALSARTSHTWQDTELTVGMRVRSVGRAGTFKPYSTGHTAEVRVAPGQTGTVQCFTDSVTSGFRNQLVVVAWDAATWKVDASPLDAMVEGKAYTMEELDALRRTVEAQAGTVALESFEATIHPSYLKPAP